MPGGVSGSSTLPRLDVPRDLKVVSYFPADAGWTEMWTDWQPDRIDADLARAASLNANTVRAIVQPDLFGYPHPTEKYTARLADFVSLAAAHGLHVQLTIFDWWYRWEDVAGSKPWAKELLSPYVNDPRIAFVELRNEILPNEATMPWVRVMVPFVQGLLVDVPVTLSVAGPDPPARLGILARGLGWVQPDFWDIHDFSGDGGVTYTLIKRAQLIAGMTPVWIGEAGDPTTTVVSGCGGGSLPAPAREGAAAVRVAPLRADRAASVSIVPPSAGVQQGTRVAVRALARRATPGGSVFLVVEWLNVARRVVGRVAAAPLHGAAGAWEELHVGAAAPRRAAYARVDLVVRGTTTPVWFDRVS